MSGTPPRTVAPIAARPAPPPPSGLLHWLRTHLAGNRLSVLTTLVLLALLLSALPGVVDLAGTALGEARSSGSDPGGDGP